MSHKQKTNIPYTHSTPETSNYSDLRIGIYPSTLYKRVFQMALISIHSHIEAIYTTFIFSSKWYIIFLLVEMVLTADYTLVTSGTACLHSIENFKLAIFGFLKLEIIKMALFHLKCVLVQ